MDDKNINDIAEDLTIKLFHVGSHTINYRILTLLPGNIKTLMVELNLTKVPVNNRVNALQKVGLVNREMGTGNVCMTSLGKQYFEVFSCIQQEVKKDFVLLLRKSLD